MDLSEYLQNVEKYILKQTNFSMEIYITKDSENLGGFTVRQWKTLREKLKSSINYSKDWETAVNRYDNRLKNRYFNPMKNLEEKAIGEGFSLATIHCALIEHLASITQGKIHNHSANSSSPQYEYSSSSNHFQSFLKTSDLFSEYFTPQGSSEAEFDSKDFYGNVRCALLHEACTKNGWRINTLSCGYRNPNHKIMTKESGGVKRLFRDILTTKLSEFLENYKTKLKSDKKLRLYFARKLDHLCDIEPDADNYKWWNPII